MRKAITICITLALVLSLAPAAFADVDLSGMTFDELVDLKDQINRAIWDSQEWQEVEVPQGVWEVGADIPAGKWTILAKPYADTYIKIGPSVKNGGTSVESKMHQRIKDRDYRDFDANSDITFWTVNLSDGEYLQVDYGPAIFTPYAGKPSLGFK